MHDFSLSLSLSLSPSVDAQTLSSYSLFQDSNHDWSLGSSNENLQIREPEEGNKLWAEFIDDWGLEIYGNLRMKSAGSAFINGKTGTAGITFSTNLIGDAYFPLIRQTTESGHVANLGGYRDWFGFWGFDASRTINGYDHFWGMDLNTGNVCIGHRASSSHKLSVEGSIAAREVVVLASGWADFVFEEDYQLPSLKEVESHIKTNGHLKDIPSAKEVKENGVGLGEMDVKLLQKIEELTLYVIQQQKEIEALKNMIRQN